MILWLKLWYIVFKTYMKIHIIMVHFSSFLFYFSSASLLMVPCMFLMLPCMPFCGAAWWGLQLQWFGVHAVQCVARGNGQEDFQVYCSLGQGQMNADIASIVSLLLLQPRALQSMTAYCCWHTLHHAEYSNNSRAKTKTAYLFFVVFYSHEPKSPCSEFSLKSCDGKGVAQEKL